MCSILWLWDQNQRRSSPIFEYFDVKYRHAYFFREVSNKCHLSVYFIQSQIRNTVLGILVLNCSRILNLKLILLDLIHFVSTTAYYIHKCMYIVLTKFHIFTISRSAEYLYLYYIHGRRSRICSRGRGGWGIVRVKIMLYTN